MALIPAGIGAVVIFAGGVLVLSKAAKMLFTRTVELPTDNGPIISPSHLLGSGKLVSLHKGQFEGFSYNLIAAGNGRVIVIVDLKKNTGLHMVAIGAKSGLQKQIVGLRGQLLKVDLEGNYPKDFSMYTAAGTERELLQLFDPADMAYFADFCRAYDVELYRETLYFSRAASADDESDITPLTKDVQQFLHKNKRFFSRIGSSTAKM